MYYGNNNYYINNLSYADSISGLCTVLLPDKIKAVNKYNLIHILGKCYPQCFNSHIFSLLL